MNIPKSETRAEIEIGRVAIEPEDPDKRIIPADHEPSVGRREKNRSADVNIGNHAERHRQLFGQRELA